MTFFQIGFLLLASVGMLVGCTLFLGGQALVMCGRAKDIYPATLVRNIGMGLIGICIVVLILLYWLTAPL